MAQIPTAKWFLDSGVAIIRCQSGKLIVWEYCSKSTINCFSRIVWTSNHNLPASLFPALSLLLLICAHAHTQLPPTYSFILVFQGEECGAFTVGASCRTDPAVQQDSWGAEEERGTRCSCPAATEASAVVNQGTWQSKTLKQHCISKLLLKLWEHSRD